MGLHYRAYTRQPGVCVNSFGSAAVFSSQLRELWQRPSSYAMLGEGGMQAEMASCPVPTSEVLNNLWKAGTGEWDDVFPHTGGSMEMSY